MHAIPRAIAHRHNAHRVFYATFIRHASRTRRAGGPLDLLQLPQSGMHQLASLLAPAGGTDLRTMCRSLRQLVNQAVTCAKVSTVGSCMR